MGCTTVCAKAYLIGHLLHCLRLNAWHAPCHCYVIIEQATGHPVELLIRHSYRHAVIDIFDGKTLWGVP